MTHLGPQSVQSEPTGQSGEPAALGGTPSSQKPSLMKAVPTSHLSKRQLSLQSINSLDRSVVPQGTTIGNVTSKGL